MSFADESEKQNRMSFLDVKIFREDKTFTASAYHKPTFCGVYIYFDSCLLSIRLVLFTKSLIDASEYA